MNNMYSVELDRGGEVYVLGDSIENVVKKLTTIAYRSEQGINRVQFLASPEGTAFGDYHDKKLLLISEGCSEDHENLALYEVELRNGNDSCNVHVVSSRMSDVETMLGDLMYEYIASIARQGSVKMETLII